MTKQVLFIVTSHAQLGSTGQLTGLYLPELAHPQKVFSQNGYQTTVASPIGGDAPIDPKSLSDELAEFVPLTKGTLPLADIDPANYDVFFVVGGHGTVWDLPNNPDLQRILPTAYAQGKVVAAVCHGPAALVNLKNDNGEYFLQGKQVTGFTNQEEAAVKLTDIVPFLLEDALKQAGGNHSGKPNWQSNVVVDQRLVTGQNPASATALAEAVIQVLSQEFAAAN
ncbi:type 1 glutamine amidotransferase domain-containing protein [Nostoc sp. FACHB-973]|nr:type 1 glutamine amidotransferase domain-containing protein [Nostoc sp. FACHB-973]